MRVKKAGGKIFGAELTAAERKAMDIEIQKELAEYTRQHELAIDAMILWQLHEQLGFGPKRLKQFYDNFSKAVKELISYYEAGEDEGVKLCLYRLKKIGVDVEAWNKQ